MSCLLVAPFETRLYTTSATTNGEGQSTVCTGSPTANQEKQASGSTCMKVDKSVAEGMAWTPGGLATNRWYYAQYIWSTDAKPSTGMFPTLGVWKSATSTEAYELLLDNTTGEFAIYLGGTGKYEKTGVTPSSETPYIIEQRIRIPSAGTEGKAVLCIWNLEGTLLYEKELVANLGNTAPLTHYVGAVLTTQTAANFYYSQWIINDDQGEKMNGPVGRRFAVALKPVSDNAREGMVTGAGGTEKLYDATDNFPPAGVANGSKTATSQIYSATSSTAHYFRANTATYEASIASGGANLKAGDTIDVMMAIGRIGNSSGTGRSMGLKCNANPEIEEATLATSGTAGTEASGWRTITTAKIYSPTPTRSSGAQPNIRKNAATTDATACDMLAVYLVYTPAPAGTKYEKTLEETVTISDALTQKVGKVLAESVTITDEVTRKAAFKRTLEESVTISDAIAKKFGKPLAESVTISDALQKKFGKLLAESVTISDEVAAALGIPGGIYVRDGGVWKLAAYRVF